MNNTEKAYVTGLLLISAYCLGRAHNIHQNLVTYRKIKKINERIAACTEMMEWVAGNIETMDTEEFCAELDQKVAWVKILDQL